MRAAALYPSLYPAPRGWARGEALWGFSALNKSPGPLADLLSFFFLGRYFPHLSGYWIHSYRQCFYIRAYLYFLIQAKQWKVICSFSVSQQVGGGQHCHSSGLRNGPATAVDASVMHKPQRFVVIFIFSHLVLGFSWTKYIWESTGKG